MTHRSKFLSKSSATCRSADRIACTDENPTTVLRCSAKNAGRSSMPRKCARVSSGIFCFLNARL